MALSQAAVEVKPGSKVKASVRGVELADVDDVGAGGAGQNRQIDGLVAEGEPSPIWLFQSL
jgi:hypothetical protein